MMLVERAQLLTFPSPYSFPVFSTFCSSLPAAAAAAASLPLPPTLWRFFRSLSFALLARRCPRVALARSTFPSV
ncbi:hypothetical protein Q4I32_005369 [Leishmania shawi]|uniref:Secreted protein n=1 Tax=Leishmania shawi TaxID=5680 RepID=A0AAW3BIB3_9TRYP